MKLLLNAIAIIAILGFAIPLRAEDTATTKPAKGLRGKVVSVDGMVITIKNKNGETPITTDANTQFLLDGQPATLADVKEKMNVVSVTQNNGVATQVKLTTPKKRKHHDEPTTAPAASTPGN